MLCEPISAVGDARLDDHSRQSRAELILEQQIESLLGVAVGIKRSYFVSKFVLTISSLGHAGCDSHSCWEVNATLPAPAPTRIQRMIMPSTIFIVTFYPEFQKLPASGQFALPGF
jgi:hypothetical protein